MSYFVIQFIVSEEGPAAVELVSKHILTKLIMLIFYTIINDNLEHTVVITYITFF